ARCPKIPSSCTKSAWHTSTPAINTPTSSLPIKKRPLNKVAGEGTPKAVAKSFRRRYLRIAAISHTFMQAPMEQGVNAISSDPKPEPAPKDANRETEKMDGDEEEDLKEELMWQILTIRNNPTSERDQVVSTRVGYHSQ
ncbi:hypothetical protein PIB30_104601, partial [Stylosanthes scabra]|nr:hypothetical protein [Stylosanthes scabra]